jgi:dolichyl-phosphate beta-glucosyltransferase
MKPPVLATSSTLDTGRGPDHGALADLSIVIPAYNEEARLPATLRQAVGYLSQTGCRWELIVCDDGSRDRTAEVAREVSREHDGVRLLQLPHGGKAMAVRAGVLEATGSTIIFMDADLATPVEYASDALELLASGWDIVIGSREGVGARRLGEPRHRHWMGRLYNYAVQLVLLPGIKDTQCGFKAFRRGIARDLFQCVLLYTDGSHGVRGPLVTGFDVELLYLARKRNYRVYELPVVWRHVAGSKVRPGVDSMLMLRDVFHVRWNDMRGRYDG